MTKQIKTYAYHKNSESEDGSFDCFETDVELEGHTHLVLKQDHDEIVNAIKSKHELDLSELAKVKSENKKLVDALKFYASKRHPVYQEIAANVLKEIGEL